MDEIRQMHRALLELYFSALDAAHIQHIVDEGEEVLAGSGDLFQVVQHLLPVVDVGRSQRGEADDGVHRGADVVAHVEQELPLGAVCRPLVLERDLQLAVLLLQLGLILLLLLLFLLLHLLCRAPAQRLKDDHEQDITGQCHQDGGDGRTEDRSAICIRIEVKGTPVAVHPEIGAGAVPAAGVGQHLRDPDFADLLYRRAVRGVLPDQLRAVGGDDLIVLHDEQGAAGLFRVAIQNALDRQRRPFDKRRRSVPIGEQDGRAAACPVCRHIHDRPVFQQDALHIGLLRVAEDIQSGIGPELVAKPGIADPVRGILAEERALRVKDGDAGEPEPFGFLFQALRVGEVQRGVIDQRLHRDRCAAKGLRCNGIVVFFVAGGLRFDKIEDLAKALFRCAQRFPVREKDDACHEEHADDQIERPDPRSRSGLIFMFQWRPPPDTAKGFRDICRRSAPACRLRAAAQRYRSAGCPAPGCRSLQRPRPAR